MINQLRVKQRDEYYSLEVESGSNLLDVLRRENYFIETPCGGRGVCGKCRVTVNGQTALACQTVIDRDMLVELQNEEKTDILMTGISVQGVLDGTHLYVMAFDIGTTTIVGYLMNGISGELLTQVSSLNPQKAYGADVISRIQYAITTDAEELRKRICGTLLELLNEAAKSVKIKTDEIALVSIVGNTAMHHLLLGIDVKSLITPPYMPKVYEAVELAMQKLFSEHTEGVVRILPNIAGFVGADTVGCLVATRFDHLKKMTLLIDIGTNGEMVLGNWQRRIACSTAAGPAFEGANIQCGMRGQKGAIDHVEVQDGKLVFHVIGGGVAKGFCGSGLLDLVASLLQIGEIDGSGRLMNGKEYRLSDTDVYLTQKDVREVQLAKAAIRAGIELLTKKIGISISKIEKVYLAGAFGNYMNPKSACLIGMIPICLLDRIEGIGNAAGEGAKLCALSKTEYEYSKILASETEFLELASLTEFQDVFVDSLKFTEENDEYL